MDIFENARTSRYELSSKVFGQKEVQKPQGWRSDNRSLDRDKDSRSITQKIEVDLTFFGDAAEYIRTVYNAFGISERVLLYKYEKSQYALDEAWILRYVQELDFFSYKEDSKTGGITIKATEGGLFEDIKDRYDDKYDIINQFSADEIPIGELKTHPFQPKERKIYLESLLKGERFDYKIDSGFYKTAQLEKGRPIPMDVVYTSIKGDIITPTNSLGGDNPGESPAADSTLGTNVDAGLPFLFDADEDRVLQVKMNLTFTIDSVDSRYVEGEDFRVKFLTSEKVNNEQVLKEMESLTMTSVANPTGVTSMLASNNTGTEFSVSFDRELTLLKGESLSFIFYSYSAIDRGLRTDSGFHHVFINSNGTVNVIDKTEYPSTVSKCIKPLDLFDRLAAKITGKTGLVRSSIFEAGGEYEHYVVDNGFWARGFPDTFTDEDDKEITIQFNTSFKEAFQAFNYLEPLYWGVEIENGQQVLRIEKALFTMQDFIGIRLGNVDEIESESSKADYFSKIMIGQKEELEYEEVNGLDEYNGKSELSTHNRKGDTYEAICDYNLDATGYELTRRKAFINFPNTDTKRDEHIWIHHAKLSTRYIIFRFFPFQVYTHRLWQDDFSQAPTGIFDPDSAWNLTLSPMNRLKEGHGYSVKRGLYHFKDKSINFSSSNANQDLVTFKDGVALSEKSGIKVGDLPRNRVQAHKTSLSFKMTQPIEAQFFGVQEFEGKVVPNYFGLIEYLEKGELKYGRLIKLSGQEKSKLTLINAQT